MPALENSMLAPKQLAEMFGCSVTFVHSRVNGGVWPHHRLGQRMVRFSESDVQEIRDQSKRTPVSRTLRDEVASLELNFGAMKVLGATEKSQKRKQNKLLGLRMRVIMERQGLEGGDSAGDRGA